mgnify:FL=1
MGILSPKRVSPKRVKTADGDQRMAIDGGFAERVRGGVGMKVLPSKPQQRRPPRHCPVCGQDLTEHPYYQTEPGPAARWLRRVAVWLLPVMAAAYISFLIWGEVGPGIGTGAGYFALAVVGGPSLALYMLSRYFPFRRRVICLRCSWNEVYPTVRPPS